MWADTGPMGIISPSRSSDRVSRDDVLAVLEASSFGKWTLIHGSDTVEIFDSFDDAAARAIEQFGAGSYLIRVDRASTVTLPASVALQRA